jgi:hypothetical protein
MPEGRVKMPRHFWNVVKSEAKRPMSYQRWVFGLDLVLRLGLGLLERWEASRTEYDGDGFEDVKVRSDGGPDEVHPIPALKITSALRLI